MNSRIVKIDLKQYMKRIKRQKAALRHSLLFNDQEKQDVAYCFDSIMKDCKARYINDLLVEANKVS